MAKAPKLYATTPVEHDQVRYEVGDAVPVSGEAADALLACGAVTADKPAPAEAAAEAPPADAPPADELPPAE